MINEINHIISSLTPNEIAETVKNIRTEDVILRISSNYNQIEGAIRNIPVIRNKTRRFGRIIRARYRNRMKKIVFGK